MTNSMEELFLKLKEYADVRLDLFRLKSTNKIAALMSFLISIVFFIIFFGMVLACLTVGLALLLGELLGKTYLGFFATAGLYIIVGIILYAKKDKFVKKPITDKIIKEFSEEDVI
jgi:uncharacterized membrane protein